MREFCSSGACRFGKCHLSGPKSVLCKSFLAFTLTFFVIAPNLQAQWDPANGDWSKTNANDVRVMTWNLRDTICSSNNKVEGTNDWSAVVHIVASMQPDVLILQETGDNSGNGTGSGLDSISNLTTTLQYFMYGGNDSFKPGTPAVTSYVQLFAPGYDLPFMFVSSENDGFNRNIIMSRWAFSDLNGDGLSQRADIPTVSAHLYAPGGDGGIRGFMFAEIDLPNGTYVGNLVVGNAHLKSGGDASDLAERLVASQNVAYVIDHWYNGAGLGTPDPFARIADAPVATMILDSNTPIVIGGDWNEDELTNGRKGPAEWLTMAQTTGGTDGTDRDRSDSTYDAATHVFTGSRVTFGGSSKLDYLAWQDSIAILRRAWVFNTTGTPTLALPPELTGYPIPGSASSLASDHRPVIADFILPTGTPVGACCDGLVCSDGETEAACTGGGGEYKGDASTCPLVSCAPPPAVAINEIRVDENGADVNEYFEIQGAPGTSLDDLYYIVIGDNAANNSGYVEVVINLDGLTIPADGFFLAAESSFNIGAGTIVPDLNLGASGLNFENDDNVTHMIVQLFSGVDGQDLDTNDDGVFDTTPWSAIVDEVALIKSDNPPTGTELHYGPPTVGPDGATSPGHVYRCEDGTGAWVLGIFDPVGADDTPGSANPCTPIPAMSTWGLTWAGMLVVGVGGTLARRKAS